MDRERADGATFAPALVERRARTPILMIGIVLGIGGLAIGGVLEQLAGAPSTALASLPATENPPAPTAAQSPVSTPSLDLTPKLDLTPVVTNADEAIQLVARRYTTSTYVHGDVYVDGVRWVYVALQDASGRVAGWASVSVPGAAGPAPSDSPALRLDVELANPSDQEARSIWVLVNAYGGQGDLNATTRLEVPPISALDRGAAAADDVIQLDVVPAGKELFVHGDVFSVEVNVVVVSIEDVTGQVAEVRSVEIQGGSTAFRLGPNERFDAHFDVPDELVGDRLWVRADAYDATGRILEAVLQPIAAAPLGYQVDARSRGISDVWTRFDE